MRIIEIEDNELKKCNQEIINADGKYVFVDDILRFLEHRREKWGGGYYDILIRRLEYQSESLSSVGNTNIKKDG